MNELFSLKGKTIVITGASSGIGRECAVYCSNAGANLVLFGRNAGRLAETKEMLSANTEVLSISADLTDYEKLQSYLTEIKSSFREIHGLVNCAGISTTLPLKLLTPEKINEFYNTNVTAAVNLTKLITKKGVFADSGGAVIFFSSVMGVVGEIGKTVYSLTKGALVSGAKSMALELAPKKIRVNCISPGVVETPMTGNAVYNQSSEGRERIVSLHPLGLGKTSDIAALVVFMLSDASRWITGTNIFIDGGYTAR